MRLRITHCLMSMTVILFLSACSHTHTPDQRTWKDIQYPAQSVQLVLIKNDDMSKEEVTTTRQIIIQALNDLGISVHPTSGRQLVVKIVNYNEQSATVSNLRWVVQCLLPGSWAFHTWNAFDLRVRLIEADGSTTEFEKFKEIGESGRDFDLLRRNMARRVALSVLTADAPIMAYVEHSQ